MRRAIVILAALVATAPILMGCAAGNGTGDDLDGDESSGDDGATGGDFTTGGNPTTGSTSGDEGAAASSGGPPACVYPTGVAFGAQVGQTLPPTLSWQGYPEGSAEVGTVALTDYFDCDGSRGVNALLLIASQTSCGACQQEAAALGAVMAQEWGPLGVRVVTLMMRNEYNQAGSVATAKQWKDYFHLDSAVVADPQLALVVGTTVGTPLHVLVDPRTMTVVNRQEGYSPQYPAVDNLAHQNQQ